MTVQTPDTKDEQDSAYNPGDVHAAEQFGNYVTSGIDQTEAFANDSANSTDDLEKNPTFISNVTGDKQNSSKVSFIKRKGPMGLIIGLLLGGGGLAGFLLTPALMPIALVETLTNDLNDNSSWYNKKSHVLFGKKLGKLETKVGYCGSVITIRCKFSTLSKQAASDFRNAGIELLPESDSTKTGGRIAFESMRFTNVLGADGKPISVSTPSELNKLMRENTGARSTLYKAFNPSNGGFFGNRFKNLLTKWGASKAKKIEGTTDKEADESYKKANTTNTSGNENIVTQAGDADEIEGDDEDTKEKKEEAKKLSGEIGEKIGEGKRVSAADLTKPTGVLAPVQLGCAAYSVGNIVSTGAKTVKAARLAKFAMIFFTLVSSMKSGDATSAEVKQGMEILAPSTQPTEIEDPETGEQVKNPNINKNALDSEGFKLAAHGDQGDLSAFAGQYLVAGGSAGKLQKIVDTLNEKPGRTAVKTTCKVANNKVVNIIATVTGGVVGVIGAGVALIFQDEIGELMATIINKAIEVTAGADLTTNIVGVDAGNAIFAGAGVILGASAGSVGMKPGNKAEIIKNVGDNQKTNESYIAVEKYDAKAEPFNVNNKYSTLGSIAYSLQVNNPSGSILSKIAGIIPMSMKGIIPTSSASTMTATGYTQGSDRFSKCTDEAYKEIGIDADKFCNVRYVPFADRDLDEVTDYMINGHIDELGNATSDDYKNYLQFCVNRTEGWGETGDVSADDDWATGKNCLDESSEKVIMFANYTAYVGVQDDMENNLTYASTSGINIGTYNILKPGKGETDERAAYAAQNIKLMDIVGLQEASDTQVSMIQSQLGTEYSHESVATRTIFWNTSKFSFVKSGEFDVDKVTVGKNRMQWVKLKASSGGEFYVINIHPDVDSEANRIGTAEKILSVMKEDLDSGLPVIVVGDMNGGDQFATNKSGRATGRAINKVLLDSGLFTYTYESAATKKNAEYKTFNGLDDLSPEQDGDAVHLDQIYITTPSNAVVNSWENIINNNTSEASDHNPVVVNLSIPGITPQGSSSSQPGGSVQGDDYKKECKPGFNGVGYINCGGQCVDFVLFRLAKHGIKYTGGSANGNTLAKAVGSMGYAVNNTPAVNSVVSWPAGGVQGSGANSRYGHTAMVSKVNKDGSIVVEEYNATIPGETYGSRTLPADVAKKLTYAHTEKDYR